MRSGGAIASGRCRFEAATILLAGLLVFGEMLLMLGGKVEGRVPDFHVICTETEIRQKKKFMKIIY